jgi:hypothetical protein
MAAYDRIQPAVGSMEVGGIMWSPSMRRTAAATEAMYLMARYVFDTLGYRRYEWKCDSLNTASRVAAERLGFRFEGIFRKASIYKGRNRDTARYAMTDSEWQRVKTALEEWLLPSNFDLSGRQRTSLSATMRQRVGARLAEATAVWPRIASLRVHHSPGQEHEGAKIQRAMRRCVHTRAGGVRRISGGRGPGGFPQPKVARARGSLYSWAGVSARCAVTLTELPANTPD